MDGAAGEGAGQAVAPPRVWTDMAAFDRWFETYRVGKSPVSGFELAAFFRWVTLGEPGSSPPPDPMPPYPADLPWPEERVRAREAPPAEVPWDDEPPSDGEPEVEPGPPAPPRVLPPDLLVAYVDGSGNKATGPSGAGVVIVDASPEALRDLGALEGAVVIEGTGVVVLEESMHLGNGSNNHAEVCAAGLALLLTDLPGWRERPLEIRTDSTYTQWALSRGADLPEARVNARIINAARRRQGPRPGPDGLALPPRRVSTFHVAGHAGEPGNERADALAGRARLAAPRPKPKAVTP